MNICKKKEKNWKIAFFEVQISNISQELQEANWREFIQQIDRVLTVPSTIYLQIQMCTLKCQFFCLLLFLALPQLFWSDMSIHSSESWQCEILRIDASHSTIFFCSFLLIKLRTVCKNKIASVLSRERW